MYDCAGKIADGEEVDIILGSHAAFSVSVEDLASTMDISCRVYGVSADERTLRRVNELRKENLMLPFLPGAFL
jgi:transcriptional regulator of met regulon